VISVAAVDADAKLASFSQRNEQVELAAPGVGVLSTVPGGHVAWNGTSMATPHVSGVAALVWSRNPSATNQQIRNALRSSAFDVWPEGRDDATGFGIVRARPALAELDSAAGGSGSGGAGSGGGEAVDCQAVCGCAPP
jgi:subtilisin family serine protease